MKISTYNPNNDWIYVYHPIFKKGYQYDVRGEKPLVSLQSRERPFKRIENGWITCYNNGILSYRKRKYDIPLNIQQIQPKVEPKTITWEDYAREFADRSKTQYNVTISEIVTTVTEKKVVKL